VNQNFDNDRHPIRMAIFWKVL